MAPQPTDNPSRRSSDNKSFDLSKLEYYQKREAQRTMVARALLLTMIFGMLAWNMALTQRNYEAVVVNMDQTRLAQSQLIDGQAEQLILLESRLDKIEVMVQAQQIQPEAVAIAE